MGSQTNSQTHNMNRENKGMRLVLFPLPFQGHITPMLELAQILFSKGFSITIIHTNFNSPNPLNHPHFTFIPIPDGLSESDMSTGDVIELITFLNVSCVEPFRCRVAELLADGEGEQVGCLFTDVHWHCTQGVADSFKIRRMSVRTGNMAAFLAIVDLPRLRREALLPTSESNLEDPVPDFPPLKIKDLPMIKTKDPENLYKLFSSIFNETKASSGLIFNSFEELERDPLDKCFQVFSMQIFPVGPFHKHIPSLLNSSLLTQDQTCISWLDSKPPKSVLYVSFGSLAAIDRDEFFDMAWTLANCNLPFLWVVRPGMVGVDVDHSLPKDFDEKVRGRGHIVKWAPQRDVLAHPAIGGFWTHGGWNSVLESICEGVPMICHPCFGDQMVNCRYVSDVWRVGVSLEGKKLKRGDIEKAIREVMVERENGGGMIERMEDLKEKAECCLKKGGSSFKSLENLVNHILKI